MYTRSPFRSSKRSPRFLGPAPPPLLPFDVRHPFIFQKKHFFLFAILYNNNKVHNPSAFEKTPSPFCFFSIFFFLRCVSPFFFLRSAPSLRFLSSRVRHMPSRGFSPRHFVVSTATPRRASRWRSNSAKRNTWAMGSCDVRFPHGSTTRARSSADRRAARLRARRATSLRAPQRCARTRALAAIRAPTVLEVLAAQEHA
jgi:hypothetical protein